VNALYDKTREEVYQNLMLLIEEPWSGNLSKRACTAAARPTSLLSSPRTD
jgi:hypothetical protein